MSKRQFCYIDYETRSKADLRKIGTWLYACHPTTEIMCIGFIDPNGDEHLITENDLIAWSNGEWIDSIQVLVSILNNKAVKLVAHFADFEQWITEYVLSKILTFTKLTPDRWIDTMALAYYYALPGSLKDCAKALGLKHQKDDTFKASLLKLSKPKKATKKDPNEFWTPETQPELFNKLYEYCLQDNRTCKNIHEVLPPMSKLERETWLIDQRINQQGIYIDRDACEKAYSFAEISKALLIEKFNAATGTDIRPTQRAQMLAWFKEQGYEVPNTQATTLQALAEKEDLPDHVAAAIELMASANKASLAKYPAFLNRSRGDGLLLGMLAYCGAKRTKRWAGRGVQPHNLPRPKFDSDDCIESMMLLDYELFEMIYGDVATALSTNLRGMIIAPAKHDLFIADAAQFENRIAAWLADCEWKLDNFRSGIDPYKISASPIFGVSPEQVNDDQRFVGKVGELSLQYQGGINAYAKMGKNYGLDLMKIAPMILNSATAEELERGEFCYLMYLKAHDLWCKIKKKYEKPVSPVVGIATNIIKERWRDKHSEIVNMWQKCETAACLAVLSPTGEVFKAGRLAYFVHTIAGKRFLVCKLPCGTPIFYYRPSVRISERGKMTLSYLGDKGWESTYGGKLFENAVQAVQRMALRDSIINVEDKYPVRFHVHDEVASFVPKGEGDIKEYCDLLSVPREWSKDIPIEFKGFRAPNGRYKK